MSELKTFFSFYGGKWRAAPTYPEPVYNTIIEPFAGAAGYSLHYAARNIILIDKDPIIAGLWQWLIRVPVADILSIPDHVDHVDDVKLCVEARWLVGFSLNQGSAQPKKQRSKSGSFKGGSWGPQLKARIAQQVEAIRHWRVIHGTYRDAPNITATWFVDPPYQTAGIYYRYSSKAIDFSDLASWSRALAGQVIVCENEGADWLPFQAHKVLNAASSQGKAKKSAEVIWLNTSTIPAHELVADAAGVPGHDAAAHHADHGLPEHEQPAADLPTQRAEGEPAAAGAGGELDARQQHLAGREAPGSDH